MKNSKKTLDKKNMYYIMYVVDFEKRGVPH